MMDLWSLCCTARFRSFFFVRSVMKPCSLLIASFAITASPSYYCERVKNSSKSMPENSCSKETTFANLKLSFLLGGKKCRDIIIFYMKRCQRDSPIRLLRFAFISYRNLNLSTNTTPCCKKVFIIFDSGFDQTSSSIYCRYGMNHLSHSCSCLGIFLFRIIITSISFFSMLLFSCFSHK